MCGWVTLYVDAIVSFANHQAIQDDDAPYWAAARIFTLPRQINCAAHIHKIVFVQHFLWQMCIRDSCIDGVLVHASYLVNGASIIQAEHVESVTYYHIELDSHEVIFAENCPAESFLGERFRGQFHNAASYRALYPEGCAPEHMCLPLLDSGFQLDAIQRRLAGRAGIAVLAASGALRGYVDQAGPDVCAGWAQDEATPEIPVCLDIFSAGRRIGRVLANFFRGDVRDAGYGSGYHGFSFQLPENTATPIEIRRSADGSKLTLTAAAISRAA